MLENGEEIETLVEWIQNTQENVHSIIDEDLDISFMEKLQ